jgi:hypothetical protein
VDPLNEMRLIQTLRDAAATRNPYEILARSAAMFFRAQNPSGGSSPSNDQQMATALADLAVTGRKAYCLLATAPRTPAEDARAAAAGDHVDLGTAPLNETELHVVIGGLVDGRIAATPAQRTQAVNSALARAFAVAWALRGPAAGHSMRRGQLGWIAVSGEDAMPHRPTNVPAPPYEQYELPVSVPATTSHAAVRLQTRFIIASPQPDPPTPVPAPAPPVRTLPPNPRPQVPAGNEVILFLHGHMSGAEEALAIVPFIHLAGARRGLGVSVISVDLPNGGYSESFNHLRIAPTSATMFRGDPVPPWESPGVIRTPVLDFIEDFVVAFVDALDAVTPIKNRFLGVIGGSLGGNLGLRLGRRTPMPAWLNKGIVSWSAASVWTPMVEDVFKSAGPRDCVGKWSAPEAVDSRSAYFKFTYDTPVLPLVLPPQPGQWYRKGWEPCRTNNIRDSRRARQEVYSANFRQWHFRVAGEQLIYSHVDRVAHENPSSPARYTLNRARHLLIGCADDNFDFTKIFDSTRWLANAMAATPGTSLFLLETGHSAHFERPAYLAEQIVDFLTPVSRVGVPSRWESLGGAPEAGPAVSSWAANRLDIFARGPGSDLVHRCYDNRWFNWESLGGTLASDPAAVSWAANRIDVFARGTSNDLIHRWYDGNWSGWESLGGTLTSSPTVSSWGPGRLDVFARGPNLELIHRWYDGKWSNWESLGGVLASRPAAESWGASRIDVFARGLDRTLWHVWYDGQWRP